MIQVGKEDANWLGELHLQETNSRLGEFTDFILNLFLVWEDLFPHPSSLQAADTALSRVVKDFVYSAGTMHLGFMVGHLCQQGCYRVNLCVLKSKFLE